MTTIEGRRRETRSTTADRGRSLTRWPAVASWAAERWADGSGRSPAASGDLGARPLVVCTGGEPLLQLDAAAVDAFHDVGFEVAVETNGTQPAPAGLDWVCVSPKAGAELVLTAGDELKLVYPQAEPEAHPERFARLAFRHRWLQPMDVADPDAIGEALRECQGERVPLRVRLTLTHDGKANGTTAPLEPLPTEAVWRLRIARTRLDADDPLIRHKTTCRIAYEAARAEFSREEADEVLEQHALARARAADDGECLARVHREVHVLVDDLGAEGLLQVLEADELLPAGNGLELGWRTVAGEQHGVGAQKA